MNSESVVSITQACKNKRGRVLRAKVSNIAKEQTLLEPGGKCSNEACTVTWKPANTSEQMDKGD
jgi:hypothetical protein